MSGTNAGRRLLFIVVGAAAILASCFAEPESTPRGAGGMKVSTSGSGTKPSVGGTGDGGANGGGGECISRPLDPKAKCRPVKSAEPLVAKLVSSEPHDATVYVDDLFQSFKSLCGTCHVGNANLGGFNVSQSGVNFPQNVGENVLKAIRSEVESCPPDGEDCKPFMPPRSAQGRPWSERVAGKHFDSDPVKLFADRVEAWLAAKKPDDMYPPGDQFILPADKGGVAAYPLDEDYAQAQTNLGICIPDAGMVATENERACELDAKFAALERNPDGEAFERVGLPLKLAQTDLFTLDTAELARYGVIAYQPTYPLWTDDAGKLRYVRVPRGQSIKYNKETKRFDVPENTRFYKTFMRKVKMLDGSERYKKMETRVIVSRAGGKSLFGTYKWEQDESDATLSLQPLNNAEPFADELLVVVTDEIKAAEIAEQQAQGLIRNITYEMDQQHAQRRYAIPSSERCIQCHMGNEGFILGFSPLQVNRRPCDQATLDSQGYCEGGVINPTGEDELSQLDRLISYGVIAGLEAAEVPKLEDPQGTAEAPRALRTPEELVAQGYVLGNCSHCHNPIGYPTMLNPELKSLLDFLPSDVGGIFQFPLDRTSPRIKRGPQGDIQIPYITPSLRDMWPAGEATKAKYHFKGEVKRDPVTEALLPIVAPWRSLIYRNVDTPFTYTDHYAIYPHMPLNSPGFDCRAPRILGQWMVSIPAVAKRPDLDDGAQAGTDGAEADMQPFLEVKPGDENYDLGVDQAQQRMEQYRNGERFKSYCPDTSDIVDIDVLRGKRLTPDDGTYKVGGVQVVPSEGVPDHPHWTVTDLTEVPGDWTPRRSDWEDVLVRQKLVFKSTAPKGSAIYLQELAAFDGQVALVKTLQTINLSDDFRAFALKKLPFGLWETDKHQCDEQFATVPKLRDFRDNGARHSEEMRWMEVVDPAKLKGDLPVYESVPGQAVFNMICINCHGPNADSRGRQASTLQDMTGGTGRVANFRDGLFGPVGSMGANRKRVFGSDSIAARYLPWMALGGTNTKIPEAILDLVNQTPVLGASRPSADTIDSANMLQVAQQLCRGVAKLGTKNIDLNELGDQLQWQNLHKTAGGLIIQNGDAELWARLCAFENPAPIHVFTVAGSTMPITEGSPNDLYRGDKYPVGVPIGNQRGQTVPSLTKDNTFAWCVAKPEDQALLAWANQNHLVFCPDGFIDPANELEKVNNGSGWTFPGIEAWATRGAINAGLAVFVYLDWLMSKDQPPPPRYNECELLKQ